MSRRSNCGTSLLSDSVFVFWIFRLSKEYKTGAVEPHKCAEGKTQAAETIQGCFCEFFHNVVSFLLLVWQRPAAVSVKYLPRREDSERGST